MLPKIEFGDFMKLYPEEVKGKRLVNIRGTHGSGKSTTVHLMNERDPYAFEVVFHNEKGLERVLATVFPSFGWAAVGKYRTKCGGLDVLKNNEEVKWYTNRACMLPYDLIMEGSLASSIRQTYIDLFNTLKDRREIIVYSIIPPMQVCLDRIQERNGGKPIKLIRVTEKYVATERNVEHFANAGFKSLRVNNEHITREETLDWFFSNIEQDIPVVEPKSCEPVKQQETQICSKETKKKKSKDQRIKNLPKYSGPQEELYLPTKDEIEPYPWAKYYKEPNNNVKVNWDNMKAYWYWINERMQIWHKRTILKQPFPWTEDKILQENKFTNAIRDLDKGTIYYINNYLKKIDEPCDDLVKRKKEIILNTMIYRLFIKRETVDAIGFLYLDTWDEQWAKAKENLRAIKRSGQSVFHSAYYVFGLHSASPSPDNHCKTENAINLIENFWKPKLDEIYEKVTTLDMKDLLDYLSTLCCVGRFSAYEYICDWCMCHRHTKNKIVDWTDDSYVNIGPGNKKGLDFIFEGRAGLTDIELDIYLRATWKHYMKRYGYYDEFIAVLPEWMNNDINLRVIEHDCCELQKYLSVKYGVGKTKVQFKNESRDNLDSLVL